MLPLFSLFARLIKYGLVYLVNNETAVTLEPKTL